MFKRLPFIIFLLLLPSVTLSYDDIFIKLPKDILSGTIIIPPSTKNFYDYKISSEPNPYIEQMLTWNVEKINTTIFWNLSKGEGVKIAILDTGIDYNHPDLGGCFGLGCKVAGGYDFVNEDDDPMDDVGHGTGIAGIIAAENNSIGIIGIAPEAELYAVKVMDEDGGYLYDILDGLDWCLNNSMDIVVMSFGSEDYSPSLENKSNDLYSEGILLVAAAGNEGDDNLETDNITYPARHGTVIAVGSTDINDVRASSSSDGPELELSAPGSQVIMTYLNGTYGFWSGTSFAAPHVAGAAALLLSYNQSYTPDDVREILRNTSVDLGKEGKDNLYGYGRVDLGNAYDYFVFHKAENSTTITIPTTTTSTTTITTTTTSTTTTTTTQKPTTTSTSTTTISTSTTTTSSTTTTETTSSTTTTTIPTTTSSTTTSSTSSTTTTSTTTTSTTIPTTTSSTTTSSTSSTTTTSTTTTSSTTIPTTTTSSTTSTTIPLTTTTTICIPKCLRFFRAQCVEWSSCDVTTTTTIPQTITTTTIIEPTTPTTICERKCTWWFRVICLRWQECGETTTTSTSTTITLIQTTTTIPFVTTTTTCRRVCVKWLRLTCLEWQEVWG